MTPVLRPDLKVAFVTARRPDGGRRDQLWEFCRTWWTDRFPAWPIVEADVPGVFNRGASLNRAADLAGDWDVLVIIDGDVVAEPEQVLDAAMSAAESGRLTFAFDRYVALDRRMSERVLTGFNGSWEPGRRLTMRRHVSSIVTVPRALWDRICGFDERCDGWGHDDTIFAHCARVLGGGCDRIPGTVWHLHHDKSPHTAPADAGHRAAGALAARYFAQITPAGVEQLIAERPATDAVALVVITHGRRHCIAQSIPAAIENLKGMPITRLLISDDSADIEYQAWLRLNFPNAELITAAKPGGFAKNVRRAWEAALGTGLPWVFWLEDDFIVDEPVDLAPIADTLTAHPHLTQIVLKRQPWFPAEIEAGGLIEAHPDAVDVDEDGRQWVEHQRGHWTNPHLVSRRFLAEHTWPDSPGSEARFATQVMTGDRRSAFWGARTTPPLVTHIGERNGTGY